MMNRPLGEVADIAISNVDKKSKSNEQPVRLCNFTDVYYNWAISSYNYDSLMKATANDNAIEKYALKKGDVAITKDSETRDDIGVATYISDDLDNMVLGYHCALIRPNNSLLNGKYLNVVLHSSYAQKYFEANASGSGQRYTLTDSILKEMPIPLPDLQTQTYIGNLASSIDKKIENNNKIIEELLDMAKTIYDYWFLQFEFPNEEGKPYKSSGGRMVWCNELKREIPENWRCVQFQEVCQVRRGASPRPIDEFMDETHKGMPWIKISDATSSDSPFLTRIKEHIIMSGVPKSVHVVPGTLIVSNSATPGIPKFVQLDACVHDGWLVVDDYKDFYKYYLYFVVKMVRSGLLNIASGSIFKNLKTDYLKEYLCVNPDERTLYKFNEAISMIMDKLLQAQNENQELNEMRNDLLQILLSGQIKF